ncbi:peptidoglycan-binding protein [Marinobacter sp. EhC06]|jgi:peptidoglycan hydrolase-like protein with peptidoglycan-binding domain|uniref:peptidoglycan-binding domain-containing protein n=1 Tax=Marinobacter TaxID=2742 RepID=UPI0007D9D7D9|nr:MULTISPECIES: peptidoglycan-binding domain-containing protein [unclassified Marinobacter]OAN87385.1 peptidoglycan-binding protein [Marinobacter sp. EhC06]OAN95223.1 peptidoglycan-binding protein [Marinobacter sp. EhN04]
MRKATTRLGRLAAAAGLAVTLGFAPAAFADEIVALKNALYGAGYDISNVSPQMDDSTRSALTRFQQDNGLQATGILDDPTKEALGMISVQVAASAPSQSTGSSSAPTQESASSTAETSAPEEPEQDDAIEEEEDGGWSLW